MNINDPNLKTDPVAEIFARHRRELSCLARSIVGCSVAAEDVVQDAFEAYSQSAEKAHIRDPLLYLFGMVRNLARLHVRKCIRENKHIVPYTSVEGINHVPLNEMSPELIVASRQEVTKLLAAIEELPSDVRRAFRYYAIDGQSIRDVAKRLNISVGKTHSLVQEGLEYCERKVFNVRN
jgi:RNA polymerase sigma-70 factor (ECF subfamily)